ncbi:ABC transporter permease [Actinomyces sp. 2119]|uniref:Transport permease protein n=1 Tax=Actinomyces lilanjuaniae TaxID=2321394 RepID=A0ABM6Z4L5_9ACTO|nr:MULTISPECIES: ABC transporter permease [Actinomyces]AYD90252.1 ABC transporter permease [Actinomyces lilanjuaniae]RJF41516.1 ABC transporter permease [Actinomyces sp. 2119]
MPIISDLRESRELLYNLTMREVKGKYKRTALGQLWSLANPLALMVVYSLVFSIVIRVQPAPGDPSGLDYFALWLMCGLLPWSFFSNVVNGGMAALVGNENLIKKVYFPRSALLVSNSLAWLYSWSIEMVVLVVAVILLGGAPYLYVLPAMVLMVLLTLFSTGVAMMLSVANVHFRDTQYLMGIVFQIWFYANPIIYPATMVQEVSGGVGSFLGMTVFDVYRLNPFYHFILAFRNLLYDNRLPALSTSLVVLALSLGVFLVGWWVFDRHQSRLAEVL